MNSFAPILIPTLNRFEHFHKCVESLAKCTYASESDLYIALDYPLKDIHWIGYKKIDHYISSIHGFKKVIVIKRNRNYGAIRNCKQGIREIFQLYDKLIFTEDDNEFSPNFLEFINKGLDIFNNDSRVFAICGYNYPIEIPKEYKHNYYFSRTFSAWGYGTWRNRYQRLFYTSNEFKPLMRDWRYFKMIYEMAPIKPLTILKAIRNNQSLYGDSVASLENIKNDRYCVFPITSKVRNHGHDGSGLNCGKMNDDIFLKQSIDSNTQFVYSQHVPYRDDQICNSLHKYFRLSFRARIKLFIEYILFLSREKL